MRLPRGQGDSLRGWVGRARRVCIERGHVFADAAWGAEGGNGYERTRRAIHLIFKGLLPSWEAGETRVEIHFLFYMDGDYGGTSTRHVLCSFFFVRCDWSNAKGSPLLRRSERALEERAEIDKSSIQESAARIINAGHGTVLSAIIRNNPTANAEAQRSRR